MPKMH